MQAQKKGIFKKEKGFIEWAWFFHMM